MFNVLCKCSLSLCVDIIDVIKPLCTMISSSYMLICFRRINHMAINHLHSSSDVRHHHVWHSPYVKEIIDDITKSAHIGLTVLRFARR
jgi:hypothetical protein